MNILIRALPIAVVLSALACGARSVDTGERDPGDVPSDAGAVPPDGPSDEDAGIDEDAGVPCGDQVCSTGSICFRTECDQPWGCIALSSLCQSYSPVGTVCGCDGRTYAEHCDAFTIGVMLAPAETCEPVPGHIPCGVEFCDPARQLCGHHVGGDSDGWRECLPLPPGCLSQATPACSCLGDAGFPHCLDCRVLSEPIPYLELDCPGSVR